MTRPDRPTRAEYPHFESFTPRWRDNDVYGHMNNAVFYEYIDTLVNGWLIRSGGLDVPGGPVICLVVETRCVFFGSLGFPHAVEAGLRAARIGASSITYDVGLFAPGASAAAARASFTHVCVDRDARRPVEIPPALRAALRALSPQIQPDA